MKIEIENDNHLLKEVSNGLINTLKSKDVSEEVSVQYDEDASETEDEEPAASAWKSNRRSTRARQVEPKNFTDAGQGDDSAQDSAEEYTEDYTEEESQASEYTDRERDYSDGSQEGEYTDASQEEYSD